MPCNERVKCQCKGSIEYEHTTCSHGVKCTICREFIPPVQLLRKLIRSRSGDVKQCLSELSEYFEETTNKTRSMMRNSLVELQLDVPDPALNGYYVRRGEDTHCYGTPNVTLHLKKMRRSS